MKRIYLLAFLCLSLFGVSAREATIKPATKLRQAEAIIEAFYVEEVDADTIVTEAIRAMLKTLDPHSVYTTAAETREFTEPLSGKFSGIGIQFNMLDDTVYVIQTTAGGPCERVGILPGDRIISANDTVIAGKNLPNSKIMKVLRGPKGSRVKLDVLRSGEPIQFNVVRDDIPLYSVDETFMADSTTGYIRVTRFAEATASEVAQAIQKLRRLGMKNLIIDLSDNGGGYLGSAFEMAAEFLPTYTPVVSTSGRSIPEQQYYTESEGDFQDGRLVIIANQYSASSSEIFAGAMQDNDRALIVGRRTFGKGLVQRPFDFPDGSMIRLTIAKYFTPSGRCIQKHYDKGHSEDYQRELLLRMDSGELWSADSIARPDSLLYHTLNNRRPVYGGGGIIPDVFVPADTTYYSKYYRDLVAKGVINRVCLNYVQENRAELNRLYPNEDVFQAQFEIPQTLIDTMRERGETDSVPYDEEGWNRSRPLVVAIMKGLVSRDLFENGSYYRSLAPLNNDYRTALELINDPERYNSLLQGSPQ